MAQSRVMKSGLEESRISIGDVTYRFVRPDMRSLNSKVCMPVFEKLHAIVFLINLSSYVFRGKYCETGDELNEDVMHFDSICNSTWLRSKSVVFVFTNLGLAKETSTHQPLDTLPSYSEGATDTKAAQRSIWKRFTTLGIEGPGERYVYCHFITNTHEVAKPFLAKIYDGIIRGTQRD